MSLSKVVWLFLFLLGNPPTGRDGEEGFSEELGLRLRETQLTSTELMHSAEVRGRPQSLQPDTQ